MCVPRLLNLSDNSYDVNGTRTYQVLWNEVTSLGAAWTDLTNVSPPAFPPGSKRRASAEPELQPPPRRGPSLLHKLDMVQLPTDSEGKPTNKKKVASAASTNGVRATRTTALQKGKAKARLSSRAPNATDSELSDYEDAVMAD